MLKIYKEPFIQNITEKWMEDKGLQLFIKREDVIHPYVSGNKWRKLKYNLEKARSKGYKNLLTFGGAYSNHIYATAAAANEAGIGSIGVIRGEELANKPLNKTLQFAVKQGMRLHFITREKYRNKYDPTLLDDLKRSQGEFYLIPEGGTNELAIKGTKEIMDESTGEFDIICSSVGTGGTIAGIIEGMNDNQQAIGFSALKGDFLKDEVQNLLTGPGKNKNWSINTNYHFGGYAKSSDELVDFTNNFEREHKFLLDPIYTSKMLYGIYDLMQKSVFKKGDKILAIHTGGLQGRMK